MKPIRPSAIDAKNLVIGPLADNDFVKSQRWATLFTRSRTRSFLCRRRISWRRPTAFLAQDPIFQTPSPGRFSSFLFATKGCCFRTKSTTMPLPSGTRKS